jgi:TonB-dependent receptor
MSNVSRVEVIKVPTPDMASNGLGSSINIISKSGFELTKPLFTYNLYSSFRTDLPVSLQRISVNVPSPHLSYITRINPSFDMSYMHPVNKKLAVSFAASNILSYGQNDVAFPTWDRANLIQTSSGIRNSPELIATKSGRAGVEWKMGDRNEFSASVQYRRRGTANGVGTITANYGAGATGGPTFTQGASTGVGSVSQSFSFLQLNNDTTHTVLKYKHRGDLWTIDGQMSNSRARTSFGSEGHPYFSNVGASIGNLVIRGSGIGDGDDRKSVLPSAYTITDRVGNPVNVNDGNNYTIANASTMGLWLRDSRSEARLDLERKFATSVPISIKFGGSVSLEEFETTSNSKTYNFLPTATAAERMARNFGLVDSALFTGQGGPLFSGKTVNWISPAKMYDLFNTSPEYFVLNDVAAYRTRANSSKKLTEHVTAGYVRGDVRLLKNRLSLVGGFRFERTTDDGMGPLSDANAQYVRDGNGNLVLDGAGKPVPITTDPLRREMLILRERDARSNRTYDGLYPSLNASYEISEKLQARFGYARTLGRPDLGLIIPGVTVADATSDSAQRTITVINTGLEPWTANNYDLSLESYFLKGGFGSISIFQKDIKDFFTVVRTAATPELLALYGVPASESYLDYEIVTRGNGGDASVKGFEFAYKQALTFLPNWASGVQVFLNYTRNSLSGSTTADFTGFNPEVISWGASLTRPRYIVRFTMISQGETRRSAATPAGTYNWQGAKDRDSISVEYQLTKGLSVYAAINDLLSGGYSDVTLRYDENQNTPSHARYQRIIEVGTMATIGIKGEF